MRLFLAVVLTALLTSQLQFSLGACLNDMCISCGNGVCEAGEDTCLCPQDCRGCCVDGACEPEFGETASNCPSDCGTLLQVAVVNAVTGQPLPYSNVTCWSKSTVVGTVNTGAQNSYTWKNVAAGVWVCRAESVGFLPNNMEADLYLPTCYENVQIVIPLTPQKTCIYGTVRDAWTDAPIPNATAVCGNSSLTLPPHQSEPTGHFFYYYSPTGNVTCNVTAPGYLPGDRTLFYAPGDCDPERHQRVFLVPSPGIVHVTVSLDFSCAEDDAYTMGLVVSNTQVSCSDRWGNNFTAWGVSSSFSSVNPGPVNCSVTNSDRFGSSTSGVLLPNGTLWLSLDLVLFSGNLTGNVVDGRTAQPIQNALVACTSLYDYGTAVTDRNGNYLVPFLLNGTFTCAVTAEGYTQGWLSQVVLDNTTHTLDYVLLPLESVLYGKIFTYPYVGVPRATVTCRLEDGRYGVIVSQTVSSADGTYRVGDLYGPGELSCGVVSAGYFSAGRSYSVQPGSQIECDIVLFSLNSTAAGLPNVMNTTTPFTATPMPMPLP